MKKVLRGFDWDDANILKCKKHGLNISEIEFVFSNNPYIHPDIKHSDKEDRYIAVGKCKRRYIFIVFTQRIKKSGNYIRPISARHMHKKEVSNYKEYEK